MPLPTNDSQMKSLITQTYDDNLGILYSINPLDESFILKTLVDYIFSRYVLLTSVSNVDNTSDIDKPVSTAQAIADALILSAAESYTDTAILNLKDGVPVAGNTLQKLYNLITASLVEVTVADIAARNALNAVNGQHVFVLDDGDSNWALYKATTSGVGATYVKLSDPDLLNAVMSASQIKIAYESNPDTNAFTNLLLSKLNGISAGATVNATDAQLRDRSTHTGTQLASTISDFNAAALAAAPAETNSTIAAIINAAGSATPNNTDVLATVEGSLIKKITWSNVKSFLKSYFDTLYQAGDATLTALAGLATGANKIPYSTGTDIFGQLDLDTDTTLAANSDTKLASQKAVKTYADTKMPKAGGTFTGATTESVVALTDGATIAVNALLGNIFTVTLGGNRTLANPSGAVDGQRLTFRIRQDATGSRTLAFDTKFRFGPDLLTITLSTTAAKTDYIGVIYHAADDKFDVLAFRTGF